MVKNTEFIGSLDTKPYQFQHYDIGDFSLFVDGKRFPKEGISLSTDSVKTSVMGYRTLFVASGLHHSKSGLQKTHDMNIILFMLHFDLTPDRVRRSFVRPTLRKAISESN